MIKPIIKDDFILCQKSTTATKEDMQVVVDLLDTLEAHQNDCVGLAANMIGSLKRIIVIRDQDQTVVMINPEIIKTSGKHYDTEEGCLSHEGERPTKRYESIKVKYEDVNFKVKIKTYKGFTAQIIQHEIDHCDGIII